MLCKSEEEEEEEDVYPLIWCFSEFLLQWDVECEIDSK